MDFLRFSFLVQQRRLAKRELAVWFCQEARTRSRIAMPQRLAGALDQGIH